VVEWIRWEYYDDIGSNNYQIKERIDNAKRRDGVDIPTDILLVQKFHNYKL